ncbi:MAG: SH3 domain-containing protein, partial [Nesterenkonia sp.]|nr:SH3 domain-containing protein [Nesterenkonia sp.]
MSKKLPPAVAGTIAVGLTLPLTPAAWGADAPQSERPTTDAPDVERTAQTTDVLDGVELTVASSGVSVTPLASAKDSDGAPATAAAAGSETTAASAEQRAPHQAVEWLNARSGPGVDHGVDDGADLVLTPGEDFTLSASDGAWVAFDDDGDTRWVNGAYLQPSDADARSASVSGDVWLNHRAGQGVENEVVQVLRPGQSVQVHVVGVDGWYLVSAGEYTGWVNGSYLTFPASGEAAPKVQKDVETAAPAES